MQKWRTISSKNIFKAHVFRYVQVKRESPLTKETGEFDIVQCLNWVNIVAITKDNKIVLVRQYRHGTEEYSLEVPGGAVNFKEDPFEGAKRELQEETGYTSDNWKFLGEVNVNPSFMTNKCFTYLALDCEKTHEQNLDPFEEIEIVLEEASKIKDLVREKKITHSLIIAAFYFWDHLS